MKFTVLLENGTVGTVEDKTVAIGDEATVSLHDENGLPIESTGIVSEILEGSTI